MKIVIWSKNNCVHCRTAKSLAESLGFEIEERNIDSEPWSKEKLLMEIPEAKTVPQIFVDGEYVGGLNSFVGKFK